MGRMVGRGARMLRTIGDRREARRLAEASATAAAALADEAARLRADVQAAAVRLRPALEEARQLGPSVERARDVAGMRVDEVAARLAPLVDEAARLADRTARLASATEGELAARGRKAASKAGPRAKHLAERGEKTAMKLRTDIGPRAKHLAERGEKAAAKLAREASPRARHLVARAGETAGSIVAEARPGAQDLAERGRAATTDLAGAAGPVVADLAAQARSMPTDAAAAVASSDAARAAGEAAATVAGEAGARLAALPSAIRETAAALPGAGHAGSGGRTATEQLSRLVAVPLPLAPGIGVVGVGLAAAQAAFAATFRGPKERFWQRMTMTGLGLGGYALLARPALRRTRIGPLSLVLGAGSAAVLYRTFQLGDRFARRVLPSGAHDIADIYALRSLRPKGEIAARLVLIVGPAEELFWRGLIQEGLMARYGRWRGAALATAAYGSVHAVTGNLTLVGAAGVAGAHWSALYAAGMPLGALIVSHQIWDVWIFLVQPTEPPRPASHPSPTA